MSRNANRPNNEVVYLVPCKEKHSDSHLSCASNDQPNLLKTYLDNVGSSNLPIVALRNEDICRGLGDKLHCNLRKYGCDVVHQKKGFGCVLNSNSCLVCSSTVLDAKNPPDSQIHVNFDKKNQTSAVKRSNSDKKSHSAIERTNFGDPTSVTIAQKTKIFNKNCSHYKGLNIDEYVDLLSGVTDQQMIKSVDKGKLLSDSAMEVSCDTFLVPNQRRADCLEKLTAGGKSILDKVLETSVSRGKVVNEDKMSSVPLIGDAFNIGEFCSFKDEKMDESIQSTGISMKLNGSEVPAFQDYISSSSELNQVIPNPFAKDLFSSSDKMSCDPQNLIDHLFSSSQSNLDSFQKQPDYGIESLFPCQDIEIIQERKPKEVDVMLEISKLENLLSETQEAQVNKHSFISQEEATKVPLDTASTCKANINDIISDVSDILDEINTTEVHVPDLQQCFLQAQAQCQNASLQSQTTIKEHSDNNFKSTSDCIIESLFQNPEKYRIGKNGDCIEEIFSPLESKSHTSVCDKSSIGAQPKEDGLNQTAMSNVCKSDVANNLRITGSIVDTPGIPKRVAFKVRPAGKQGRSFDRGRVAEKMLQNLKLMRSTGRKDRGFRVPSSAPNRSEKYPAQAQKVNGSSNDYTRQSSVTESLVSCKYLSPSEGELRSNSTFAGLESSTNKQDCHILPVGEMGLSVTIPNTVKTSVVSFLPPENLTSLRYTKAPSSLHNKHNGKNNLDSGISSSVSPRYRSSIYQRIKPNMKNLNVVDSPASTVAIGNLNGLQQTSSVVTTFSAPHSSNCNPIYVVLPPTTTTTSLGGGTSYYAVPVTNTASHADLPKTESVSAYQFVEISGKKNSGQHSETCVSPVGSSEYAVCSSSNKSQDQGQNMSEPIRITIRTKPRALLPNRGDTDLSNNDNNNTERKFGDNDIRILKYTPSSVDKAVKNRNLVKELKVHFPSVSEAILQQLTIPPQAVHRGYLTRHDLQNLHNQALKLHYSIVYRNHVSKCTAYDCETCRDFVSQQDSIRMVAKERVAKSKRAWKNRGRRPQTMLKKPNRHFIRGKNPKAEEDDPTYEPPMSYFKSWKKKGDGIWCLRQPVKMVKMEYKDGSEGPKRCCVLVKDTENSDEVASKREENHHRSDSEPSVALDLKQDSVVVDGKHSQDDLLVMYQDNILVNEDVDNRTAGSLPVNMNGNYTNRETPIEAPTYNSYQVPDVSCGNSSRSLQSPHLHLSKGFSNGNTMHHWQEFYKSQCFPFPQEITGDVALSANLSTASAAGFPYASRASAKSQPVPYSSDLQFSPALYLEDGCNCGESCRTMKCPCARAGVLCRASSACSCAECNNPLNILHGYELDVLIARVDECLMQNLYSFEIADLVKLLASDIVLPCCGTTSKLQHIIPSTVICNCCGNAVSYSWCTQTVHLQTLCPRNHCLVCCGCKPTLHTHCQSCQQCTASASQGTCMECGKVKLFPV